MIKFEKIEVQNFNSIGHIEWEFETGIHAVKGLNLDEEKFKSNGSGKSSFFESITWVLFGKTPAGKSADAVIHRGKGGNCFVKLWFWIGDDQYRIERYRKHEDHADAIKVYINEQDKTIHPPSKNQETIDKVLKVPFSLFTSSFIIAQGLSTRFTSMTDYQRKEVIESIRDNRIWEEARLTNKSDLKKVRNEIKELEENLIALRAKKDTYSEDLGKLKKEIREDQQSLKAFIEESNEEQLETEIKRISLQISEIVELKNKKDEDLKTVSQKIENLHNQVRENQKEIDSKRDKISEYDSFSDITRLSESVKEEEKKLESLKKETDIEDLIEERIEKDEELQKLQKEFKDKNSEHKGDLEKEIEDLSSKTQKLENELSVLEEKKKFYEHSLDDSHDSEECPTCGHLPEEKDEETLKQKNKVNQSRLEDALSEKDELVEKRKLKKEKLAEVEKELSEMFTQIEKLQQEIDQLKQTQIEQEKGLESQKGILYSERQKLEKLSSRMKEEGLRPDEVDDKISQLKNQISVLQKENKKLQEENLPQLKENKETLEDESYELEQKKTKLEVDKEDKKKELNQIELKKSSIESSINVKTDSISDIVSNIESVINDIQECVDELEDFQDQEETLSALDDIFSPKGIRAHIIAKDVGFINERLDVYSKHFFNDMYVQLDPGIDEDGSVNKIDIPVSTTLNFDKTYEDCSGGEKRRIDISVQLAIFDLILSMSSVTTNLLVLDEVFEGLDDEGVKAVMDVVSSLGENLCVYVISHQSTISNHVEKDVTFVKKEGTTYLESQIENDNFYEVT